MDVKVGDKVRIGSEGSSFVEVIAVESVFFYFKSRMWSGNRQHGQWIIQTSKCLRSNIKEVQA